MTVEDRPGPRDEGWPPPQNDQLWRTVNREGHVFRIYDGPRTSSWSFWDLWARHDWETETLAAIDAVLPQGGRLLDVGAWVGPVSLWAGVARNAEIVAMEPDPEACDVLRLNLGANMNPLRFQIVPYALDVIAGERPLYYETPGNSVSSLLDMGGDLPNSVQVTTVRIQELCAFYGWPNLVKIDIEGGEGIVFPTIGPMLRGAHIPVIIALHPQWLSAEASAALAHELNFWSGSKDLGGHTYLLTP
jgi:FkbM family methyltransferase